MDSESRMSGFSRTLRRTGSLPLTNKTVRIVILGQAAVGKTAMAVRFITRRFIGEYDPTLESIYRHEVSIGGDVVNFEILDTAGQEEDALLIGEKIRWGDGFLIVYSVTDRCSFDEVMRLCFLVGHHVGGGRGRGGAGGEGPPPVAVVANKRDLQYDRMVSPEEGRSLARGLKLPFCEISVRDGPDETTQVFHDLYAQLLRQADAGSAPSASLHRRRGVSKLMERIPRLSSSAGAPPRGGGAAPGPPATAGGPLAPPRTTDAPGTASTASSRAPWLPGAPGRSLTSGSFRELLSD